MASGNRPITFEFLADVSDYLKSVKGMSVSTDDLADALNAVTLDADDMQRKLSRAMKEAEQDTESLERAIKDIPAATQSAASQGAGDFDRIGDSARDAGADAGNEFKQNLGQTLASGGSPADMIMETLGGLTAGASGVVGTAAAVLAGVGALAIGEVMKRAEELEAYLGNLRSSLESLYTQGVLAASDLEKLEAFSAFAEENRETFAGWQDELDGAGISMDDFMTASFEGGAPLENMLATLQAMSQETGTYVDENGRAWEYQTGQAAQAERLLGFLESTSEEQSGLRTDMEATASATQQYAGFLGLVDTNMDGIITDADKLAEDTEATRTDMEGVNAAAGAMPNPGFPQMLTDAQRVSDLLNNLPQTHRMSLSVGELSYSGSSSDQARYAAQQVYAPRAAR